MKYIFIILILLCLNSCSKPDDIQPIQTKTKTIIEDEEKQEGITIIIDPSTTEYEFDIFI